MDQGDDSHQCDHAALFERARAGDEAAWRQLIVGFHPVVERAVRRVCRSSDVDDVVQEVWLILLRHGHSVRSPERLPGWLQRVAVNAALRHVCRPAPVPSELSELDGASEDDPSGDLVATSARSGVESALQRLKAEDRRLLLLLMASDRPDYATISRAIGRPIGSIGPTRRRLLERLSHDPAILHLTAS